MDVSNRKVTTMARSSLPARLEGNRHPLLLEVNVRVLLTELSRSARKRVLLGSIPDALLDRWADLGFDAVWLMGVWTTGSAGRDIARSLPGLAEEYGQVLPDFSPEDVGGSPYAVQDYEVSPLCGGPRELTRLRKRLADRGLATVLDFVVNHTATDHAWVRQHPEYYINGTSDQLRADPGSWFSVPAKKGEKVLAHGRDPMFPAWTDTAQVNHLHAGARGAMIDTLRSIADQCDGVRADMAMLVLREVFERQWGAAAGLEDGQRAKGEFWSEAISTVRAEHPGFLFIAEAYWDLEWQLQQLGFDFTYDKKLYDRMRHEGSTAVRDHLRAEMSFQLHSLRFIENHDEPRAAAVFRPEPWHYASAVLVLTIPGMAMIHEGQMEGRTRKVPVQLLRRPDEPTNEQTLLFYERLLHCLRDPGMKSGEWRLLEVKPAWHDNQTWEACLAFCWHGGNGCVRFIVVNYSPHSSQCYVAVPLEEVEGPSLEFRDLMSEAVYVRDRQGLATKGMYIDLPGYGFYVFSVSAVERFS